MHTVLRDCLLFSFKWVVVMFVECEGKLCQKRAPDTICRWFLVQSLSGLCLETWQWEKAKGNLLVKWADDGEFFVGLQSSPHVVAKVKCQVLSCHFAFCIKRFSCWGLWACLCKKLLVFNQDVACKGSRSLCWLCPHANEDRSGHILFAIKIDCPSPLLLFSDKSV